MFAKKTLRDVDVRDRVVLVRADYNAPIETDPETNQPQITSDFRIRANLPTLEYLLEHQAAKIVIMSHLGRPAGRDEQLTLQLVAEKLAQLLPGRTINFVDNVAGPEVEAAIAKLPKGGILLLENLRFFAGEKENSAEFAQTIVESTHADLFVQDGFAVTHRAHASTAAITQLLPSVAGLLLEQEVITLSTVLRDPERPFVVMLGGAKVADKQPLIELFTKVADQVLVGGKIAADGYASSDPKVLVAADFDEDAEGTKLDIGPVATMEFLETLPGAKTVLWNGVMGKVEDAAYATSSTILAKYLGEHREIKSIICGGDTAGFVEGLLGEYPELHFSLISTGGGAALELLSGKRLPGLDGLQDL